MNRSTDRPSLTPHQQALKAVMLILIVLGVGISIVVLAVLIESLRS